MNILKKNFGILTGIAVFIVYIFTLAPTVIQIDVGELASVQATLGIAHPTGYPLFTILGYLFNQIPLPFSSIYKLNLLSALWCAIGVILFVYTAKLFLEYLDKFQSLKEKTQKKEQKRKKKQKEISQEAKEEKLNIPEKVIYISAIAGGLMLAFGETYWFQSTAVEVYSLHIMLLLAVIYFLLKAFIYEEKSFADSLKYWMIFSLFLALGFSNHMTTLLILPGVAYLYFNKYGFMIDSFKRLAIMISFFVVILLLFYSYLPFRASQNPYLNWGNPVDWERIWRHVSGQQYQVWLFSSTDAAKKQFLYFINSLPGEFTVTLFLSAAGLIFSFAKVRKLFNFLLISFLFTIIYSINYDISDIDAYFLLAYTSLAFFAVLGAVKIFDILKTKKEIIAVPVMLIALFIGIQIFINYNKVDQSKQWTYEDYTLAIMEFTDENGLLFSYQWDYFLSATYYYQFVEGIRKDIAVIDKELLRRSWYYHQLETCYPGLFDGIKEDVQLFLEALQPFERNERYNPNLLEIRFRAVMTNLVSSVFNKRTFYVAPELFENEMQRGEFTLPDGYTIVPDIFMFKVVNTNEYIEAADPDFSIRFPKKMNRYTTFIEQTVGAMLARRALYELQHDKSERAKVYVNKIINDFPNYRLPPALVNAIAQ